MNSSLNKNIALFKERFPFFAGMDFSVSEKIIFETAKNGSVTARENSLMLHSKYNPEREAASFVDSLDFSSKECAVFLGVGLGYSVIEFARKFPSKTIIIFENDPSYFSAALSAVDWEIVFRHKKLVIALEADSTAQAQILKSFKSSEIGIIRNKAHSQHSEEYFDGIQKIADRLRQNESVNENTLEKFSRLWMRNSCRNLEASAFCQGIEVFRGKASSIPFVVIAAGPSLEKVLPRLREIQSRAVTVCVDTALHACLSAGVQPDFVILADPQFYAAMHLEFLEARESFLVTEIACYPSVLRFPCRKRFLFSSQFPVGRYFEENTGSEFGQLAAGGSVTTSAWDFARFCGASEIFIAGMDLGFPGRQTHIRGSQFEEKVHMESSRTSTSEQRGISSLFSASVSVEKDYNGCDILSDRKMAVFAWWFRNEAVKARECGVRTFSLTPESMAIEGIEKFSVDEFLGRNEISGIKKEFLAFGNEEPDAAKNLLKTRNAMEDFRKSLDELSSLAKKGAELCRAGLCRRDRLPEIYGRLGDIDSRIVSSSGKKAASLLFPTERQLKELTSGIPNETPADKEIFPLKYSAVIYSQILEAIKEISSVMDGLPEIRLH